MSLKIGLMGSASVGKSTTADSLGKALGINVHRELESTLIKDLIEKGEIKDKSSFTPKQSKRFQNNALSIREKLIAEKESFISDRVAGELWTYHKLYCGPHSTEEELDSFRKRCLDVTSQYNHLFLFPFGQIPIDDNNYRNTNPEYQKKIHTMIEEMLDDFQLKYIQLTKRPLSKEERLDEVLSWIKK